MLLVEDDATYAEQLTEQLSQSSGIVVTVAGSRDSACALITSQEFDLIICDLRIPSQDGELDAETAHGEAVIALARARVAGTPIVVHSAFGTLPFATRLVEDSPRCDLTGDGREEQLIRYRTKDNIGECLNVTREFARRLNETDDIEIRDGGASGHLSAAQMRVVKIFARSCAGHVVRVESIAPGFSAASTFRVYVKATTNQQRGLAFAKVGALPLLQDEASRYRRHVLPLLTVGSFCTLQLEIRGGAGPTGALFYQLAEDAPSLFDVLRDHPDSVAGIVGAIAANGEAWVTGVSTAEILVGDLRARAGVADIGTVAEHLDGVDYQRIEARKVMAGIAVQHGDLHGGNVLVNSQDHPVLIDFGSVEEWIAGYDAITLELSVLFHPAGLAIRGTWPTAEQALHWKDLDAYTVGCPVAGFIRKCREWAYRDSPSDRAVFACVYAYAVRQLRFPDTDKTLARALVSCAGAELV